MRSRPLRLKHLAALRVSNVDKKSHAGEVPVRLVNYTDVYYRDRIVPELELMKATATEDEVEAFHLLPGDVIITKDSETAHDIGIVAYVERSSSDLLCGYHLAICRPRSMYVDSRFLFWSLNSDDTRGQFSSGATGVTRYGLRADVIGDVRIVVPSLCEQRKIADYLDIETARIDKLIVTKRDLVNLLKERLLSTIEETLLCGYQDEAGRSNTEEPSVVAESHRWRPLKHYCSGQPLYGLNIPASEYRNDSTSATRFLRTTDIKEDGSIALDDGVYLDSRLVPLDHRLEPGDLLFSRSGTLGRCLMYPAWGPQATFAGYLVRFRPNFDVDPRYIAYCARSICVQGAILSNAVSSTISNFNAERYANLRLPWRPFAEQRLIADYLDAEAARSNLVIGKLVNQIDLLAGRRQALITSAVAGELEIPGR